MVSRSPDCPRCGGSMEDGYIIDETRGYFRIPRWVAGAPQRSMWTGLKLRGKERLEVTTYRCRGCGFLENYASVT